MKTDNTQKAGLIIYLVILIGSMALAMFGALLKVNHYPGAEIFLVGGLVASLVYMPVGLLMVFNRKDLSCGIKALWTFFFVISPVITGLVWYALYRRSEIAK